MHYLQCLPKIVHFIFLHAVIDVLALTFFQIEIFLLPHDFTLLLTPFVFKFTIKKSYDQRQTVESLTSYILVNLSRMSQRKLKPNEVLNRELQEMYILITLIGNYRI